jgi:hypothetical protein
MKNLLVPLIILLVAGCSKLEKDGFTKNYDCKKLTGFHKFIYEPIVISSNCNCIVSGKVKYLKNCKTVALLDYGNGNCDNVATKIICVDGNCFDENKNPFFSSEFIVDCNSNNIEEGQVNTDEIENLFSSNSEPQP